MDHVTIDEVSVKAGVSKTTVSRYLNARFEHMSEKTKLRIKEVIEELDYRPNIIARNLKVRKTGLIGVVISDVANPITPYLIKGVMDYCSTEGYQVVTASSNELVCKEQEYIQSMVDRQIDGLIVNIVDYNNYELISSLKDKGINIVLADRTLAKTPTPLFDTVTTDNYEMTRTAVKELYSMGYEAVALFSSDLLKSIVRLDRYNAFLTESKEYIQNPEGIAYVDSYKESLKDFMELYKGKRLAAFASTPMALLNLLNAAYELDIKVPDDLGVCGYDNLDWTPLISGGISVIEQPFYEVGVESAKILLKRISGELDCAPKYVELKSKLILRNSTLKMRCKQ